MRVCRITRCRCILLFFLFTGCFFPAAAKTNVVDIVTTEYRIEAPATLPTGWTTFMFTNKGAQAHFVVMYRLAEGKTIDDQLKHVAPVFEPLMQGLRSGELTKADIGPFFEEHVPDWGLQMTWAGGAGLLAAGRSTQATFLLDEPGTYLVECYVKAPDGSWHTLMGMLQQITVKAAQNNYVPPEADYTVTVSNQGVSGPQALPPGTHTFRIEMQDTPQGFMPYDLNLAKLTSSTDLDKVFFWMDWTNVGGLRAPAPVTFLGGLEHTYAGKYGFVTVDLEPGRYLWVSEINAATVNLPFEVKQ